MNINIKHRVSNIILQCILIVAAIIFLVPFFWMIISSFKNMSEIFTSKPLLLPKDINFTNYINLFKETEFIRWFINSTIVSSLSLIIGLLICSLAGFAFAAYIFKGKKIIFWTILASVTIPKIVTIIPVFKLMVSTRLVDTYLSLILPYSMNVFGIFLMKQYISSSLPKGLLDAARIDGASEIRIYFQITLPIIKPGLSVLGIYLWLFSWERYFWPLIMIKSEKMHTLTLGLATLYADPWSLDYGVLMAGAFIATLPIIVLFLFAQEQFISGLTGGSVK